MRQRIAKISGVVILLCGLAIAGCPPSNGPDLLDRLRPGPVGGEEDSFTIMLYSFRGPKHVYLAKDWKLKAEEHTGWRGLFVVHKADNSKLYWGRYRSIDDAQADLKKAKTYRTGTGAEPFAQAIVAVLPGKEVGRPEWSLIKAQGVYTVLIAVFYDVPEADYVGRRRFAAEYCQQLRDQGQEAYYKHDASQSIVTVGAFPAEAIKTVVTDGKRQAVVTDERINAIRKRHPFLAVNGRKEYLTGVDPKTNKPVRQARESYVTKIPKEEKARGADSLNRPGQPQPR